MYFFRLFFIFGYIGLVTSLVWSDVCQNNKCYLWPSNPAPFQNLAAFLNAKIYCTTGCTITIVASNLQCTSFTACSTAQIAIVPLCQLQALLQVNSNLTITTDNLTIMGQDYQSVGCIFNSFATYPTAIIGIASPISAAYSSQLMDWTCNLFTVRAKNVNFKNIQFLLDPTCYQSNLNPSVASYAPIVYERGGTILLQNLFSNNTNFGMVIFNQPLENVDLTLSNLINTKNLALNDPNLASYTTNFEVILLNVAGVIKCDLATHIFLLGSATGCTNVVNATSLYPLDPTVRGCGPPTLTSTSYCDHKEQIETNLKTALIVLTTFFGVLATVTFIAWYRKRKLPPQKLPTKLE